MMQTSSTKQLTGKMNTRSNIPTSSRQGIKKVTNGKTPVKSGKPNSSILNFFKKVDSPVTDDGGLFFSQGARGDSSSAQKPRSPSLLTDVFEDTEISGDGLDADVEDRYNEDAGPVKRRRISSENGRSPGSNENISTSLSPENRLSPAVNPDEAVEKVSHQAGNAEAAACSPPPPETSNSAKGKAKGKRQGPFLDDSDSEEDDPPTIGDQPKPLNHIAQEAAVAAQTIELDAIADEHQHDEVITTKPMDQENIHENIPVVPEVDSTKAIKKDETGAKMPSIKREATSFDDLEGFEDVDDFRDEYEEGEEFMERRWMEEQAQLEAADEFNGTGTDTKDGLGESITASCPICEANLTGVTGDEATRHVNACLDGQPIPLTQAVKAEASETSEVKHIPPKGSARFSKAAIARPGQTNPFDFDHTDSKSSSAFSKLMSSHAEDAAWAGAAAAEHAARGKPAYQRTCPFYKIMPGFFICVDAFRYGAIKGCNAYFLSHFHSDHYVGLTSSWCHGPIYCSKVTANLVKQQLRVDPKWVVALDFEARFEVPGTQGVAVSMIPANHCPGSSLYLFEKVIGKGSNPKIQRILHCGDFRACPAHIEHPLLMPDVVDTISGKTRQQKIDACYLDTTYLNPRYAFPAQEDVIKSCADMCVSLSKDKADDSDAWEKTKKERAGAGMAKFVNSNMKNEDSIAMEVGSEKKRGRLLVICGTYSIGKERICMGIARALDCKIWAAPGKQRICAALEDPELMSRLTDDPREAQIHMQMLMEIRAETLQEYLNGYKPHFSRIVGFRPSGWNYRPPNSR
jgi:DNA cross-link repair 1A protein